MNAKGVLDKTSGHLFVETDSLLQSAISRASEARHAGGSRSRGYASLVVLVVGLLFQSGGIFALGKLVPQTPNETANYASRSKFTDSEAALVRSNIERVRTNANDISLIKNRIAPSMPIDPNVAAIQAAVLDIQTLILPENASSENK